MGYRDRNSYDDMDKHTSKSQDRERMDPKSFKVIVLVVLLGVILCVAVVMLWLTYFSTPKQTQPERNTSFIVEPLSVPSSESPPSTESPPSLRSDQLGRTPSDVVPVVTQAESRKEVWYFEHTVGDGENLDSLSQLYGITKETILSVNAIRNLSAIKEGVVLKIPDRDGQLYTVQSGDSLSIITNRFNPTLGWKTLQELNGLSDEGIFPGQKLFIPSVRIQDDGSLASFDRFIRPTEGRITGLYGQTVKYGSSEEIVTLRGIWIEHAQGTSIKASSTGVVVDVGNIPATKGRFVVLSHDNGYRTTYAHLESVDVKVGDQVRQGASIGTMGSSGSIEKPTLFFSIEQDGTALNPANFFL